MVEIVGKISKGTKMDQIYIPKNRSSLPIGSYVVIKPLEEEKKEIKPFFYNVDLEPIKVEIIKEIIKIIDQHINTANIIITGSFLEKGFRFNDIDILLIGEEGIKREILEKKTGINIHIIQITNKALIKGLETDPLYKIMLSKCVSKERLIYKTKQKINYKLLDLHLLKSNLLNNFDILTGNEKYEMVRNLIAIKRFIHKKDVSKQTVDYEINRFFGDIRDVKNNIVKKNDFIREYKKIYSETENLILKGIKNESKQE